MTTAQTEITVISTTSSVPVYDDASRSTSRDALRTAVGAASPDAVIELSPDGVVLSWNAAATQIYGLKAGQIVGRSFLAVVPVDIHQTESRIFARAVGGEIVASHNTSRVHADGNRVLVSVGLSPVYAIDGTVRTIVAVERDVTRERTLEAELLHAKRLEALGRLSTGVAQEFSNLHTSILGLADFVDRALPAATPIRDDLIGIKQHADRGAQLAQHLLAFGARDVGAPHTMCPASMIRALSPLLHRLTGERVSLTIDCTGADTAEVVAEDARLEIVLFELVFAATRSIERGTIGATEGGGRIDITIAPRTAEEMETLIGAGSGPHLQLTVAATSHAESATRMDDARDRPLEHWTGTDASPGLAMLHAVLDQIGGRLHFESSAGHGGQWHVFLPRAATSSHAGDDRVDASTEDLIGAAIETTSQGETILVVEDEKVVRDVLCRGLEERGYDVLTAADGEDALAVAERHSGPIHLVISDVVMPVMDGRELFSRLRGWYPNIRFLFISGYMREAVAPSHLDNDRTAFLAKPFTVETLVREGRRLMGVRGDRAARRDRGALVA
jgi:two-component system cell cycle sensor histidine kinase/response regulator CckA